MQQRGIPAGKLHPKIVGNGAEGNRSLRYKALPEIIDMGHQTVSRGQHILRRRKMLNNALFSVKRQISSPVLPCIQRAQRLSLPIQIQDPVHLTCQSYPAALRKLLYKGIQHAPGLIYYKIHILDTFVLVPRGDEAVVLDSLTFKNSIIIRIIGCPADGGGTQIYTVNDHFETIPLKIRVHYCVVIRFFTASAAYFPLYFIFPYFYRFLFPTHFEEP